MAGHAAPVVQNPAPLQGRVKPGEAPARGPRVDLVKPLAHVRVRRRPRHPEQGARASRHDRILALAHLAVEPRKRRKLEAGHRQTRHQTVGKADATGAGRIGDAVKTLSRHVRHPRHRQMPAEGVSRGFCSLACCFSGIMAGFGGKSPRKNVFGNQVNPLQNSEKKF